MTPTCVFTVMERFAGLCCMPLTTQKSSVGAPLDAAQHPEELCTIDSLDLFLEHSVESSTGRPGIGTVDRT